MTAENSVGCSAGGSDMLASGEVLPVYKGRPGCRIGLPPVVLPAGRAYALAQLALQLALQPADRKDGFASLTANLAMEDALSGGDAVNPFVFELIAVVRGILCDLPGALQVVDSLKDTNKVWPLWNITEQLVGAGKKDEALTLAHAQEAPRARAYALLGTATALLEQVEAASKHE